MIFMYLTLFGCNHTKLVVLTCPCQLFESVDKSMAEGAVQEGKTLKELEKEITCSVCQEHYTEPKVLPCLHYYCKECVLRLALRTASNEPFSCPECRKETTLPEGGVEELKTAFFINRLKSNFSALEKVHGKFEVQCEGCTSSYKAEAFCRHCAVFICKDCVVSHKKIKVFSSHEVVSLEDLKQGQAKQIAVAEPATKKCSIHEEPLLIYCFDCNSLICRDCTVKKHRDHNFEFSKVASPKAKKNLIEEIDPLKSIAAELSSAIGDICTNKEEVEAQGKSLIQAIENSFEELHSILNERKKELVQETLKRVEEKTEKLSVQEKTLSLASGEVQSIIDYTERFVGHCSDNEVMSLHADIKRQIQREMEEHSKSERSLEPEEEADIAIEVKCKETLQELLQTMAKVTQIAPDPAQCTVRGDGTKMVEICQTAEVYLTTRLSNGRITKGSTAVVSELKSVYSGSVIKCKVDQSRPGEYRIQYTPTVRGHHELSVSVDGQQVAGSPFPVFVSISPTQLGKPVNMWRDIRRPRGITSTPDNNILVAVEKGGVIKLNENGGKTLLVEHFQSDLEELEGIATDKEGNIYCTDYRSNKIMKCNKNGTNVQVYKVQQVAGPGHRGVAVAGDEVMLCECSNTGTIMIYNKELEYVRRIQHEGGGEFRGVSADINGDIYVTDYSMKSIQVFSNDGIFLRSFCSETKVINKRFMPYRIYISGQYAYVTNTVEDYVSVLTTSGYYVSIFGQRGENRGAFFGPCGVCVDNDGFVYVTEYYNDRIQSF